MTYEEYCQSVLSDAEDVIAGNFDDGYYDAETDFAEVFDELFIDVTGNANGSYTFDANEAKEYVKDTLYDANILAALENMGVDKEEVFSQILNKNYETLDVLIRCAVLSSGIYRDAEAYFNTCQSDCEE